MDFFLFTHIMISVWPEKATTTQSNQNAAFVEFFRANAKSSEGCSGIAATCTCNSVQPFLYVVVICKTQNQTVAEVSRKRLQGTVLHFGEIFASKQKPMLSLLPW